MIKLIITLVITLFLGVGVVRAVESTPSSQFDPHAAFWPLSAGKTIDDNLFFLKSWKETLRGWFIFGGIQKADYEVQLTIKRLLEVDKLIGQQKGDAALKTLDKANLQLTDVFKRVEKIQRESITPQHKLAMIERLQDMRQYIEVLKSRFPEGTEKLTRLDETSQEILNILQ